MGDVVWEPGALDALLKLAARDQQQARRLARTAVQFADGGSGDVVKLQGATDRWRLRSGDWRLVFVREGENIRILEVVNRRDAYR